MPRKVDHRERRELLADALMRLAATQGLEGVSLRHVAAEAGVSTGMVQHYFRTKDEMMTFAFGMVEDRIRARCEAADTPAAPRELVRALLLQILPLDDTRRLEGHVGLAFLAYAAVKPAMRAGVSEGAGRMRGFITQQLRQAGADGVDPDRAATGLMALVDGLGMQLLSRQFAEEEAVAALDAHLDLIFDAHHGTR
ncbi:MULTISPECIES: TetR/AcrR family transcriptional regulator [Streptomyces]|uniref:TetR/AcrR family transcriptional regulator n=1 Tax=Streptomyces TaxID=1883 RepID=UPI00103BB49D|nr:MULTISPECIES: TetR family transcriptional regulator C-terminal domain-containing protein [Streptomyces]MBT3080821.1 TetR family transcriptional regulator C-terminal domain-containing protein [Streptomyces sp. COG20]MBT3086821.1 TetR family transcriptional regulator C-terminal domain-containing protein [Streptomyces sp. CYG21]MBT3099827.1 TetR family transcriptional regulator C-terminal domain-containing protein [Streptomyces sp. CBG30]MBT3102407.1 TetR family transcriptional regulator C-term